MSLKKGLLLLLLSSGFCLPAYAIPKLNVGWVEKIKLVPGDLIIHAKLDTGAESSSIDAQDVEEFTRAGSEWIRFSIVNRYGDKITIENKIHRMALVKRHFGKTQRRKVIKIGICLGETYMQTEVTLINRKNFEYQMLLGRQFLAGNAVVDPSITYTAEPGCHEKIAEISAVKKKKKKLARVNKSKTNKPEIGTSGLSKSELENQQSGASELEKTELKEPASKDNTTKQADRVSVKREDLSPNISAGSGQLVNTHNSLPPAAVPEPKKMEQAQ
jgi:hypothetical protein